MPFLKKFLKFVFIFMVLLEAFLPQSGGSQKKEGQRLEHIRLGTPAWQSMPYLPIEVGIKKGFYRREGINLDVLILKSHLTNAAIKSGDIEYLNNSDAMVAAVQGIPVKVAMVINGNFVTYFVSKPSIKSIKELKGKIIGAGGVRSTAYFLQREMLMGNGLDPDKDLTMVSVGAGMTIHSLMAGAIDATTQTLTDAIFLKRKGFNILARSSDYIQLWSVGLIALTKRIKENPNQVKKMIRASLKALFYTRDREKREEMIEFIVKEWGRPRDMAEEILDDGIKDYARDGTVSDKATLNIIEMAKKAGRIKGDFPISQLVDFSLLREVQKELKIIP